MRVLEALESRWRDDDRARRPAASCQLECDPAAEPVSDHCWCVQAEAVQLGLDRIGQARRQQVAVDSPCRSARSWCSTQR